MGNQPANMGLSNSTPFELKVMLHHDRKQVLRDSSSHSHEFNVGGSYGGAGADVGFKTSGSTSGEYAHQLVDP